ncbi:hypothetical protein [Pedobacter xixiisoli]|uniref:Beta-lactamase-inhibitor-like, PepSY-like n=1 Tax=Pedobacter xixiisoli TaxID=1476464 RepID=A0A286AEP8_9SPHI|nr:hypothetical protein [Pedobacter xixiisoli]SOD20370.1 hypothetical protein SAMN06297358_4087 [Pedobacter xixiisoli]
MKKLFVAAIVAFAGFTATQAQASVNKIEIVSVQDSVVKTPIEVSALPDAIKTVLATDPYKDWTPTAAFSVKDGDKAYFQVDVKKAEETASLKFDAEGKPVEFAGVTATQAQVSISNEENVSVQDSVVKTPIEVSALPDAIKTVLATDPYKAWTPTAAFSVKDGDKSYFQVDVKKEEETASLKFDAEGKPVE